VAAQSRFLKEMRGPEAAAREAAKLISIAEERGRYKEDRAPRRDVCNDYTACAAQRAKKRKGAAGPSTR
jgi:hypothetical protein